MRGKLQMSGRASRIRLKGELLATHSHERTTHQGQRMGLQKLRLRVPLVGNDESGRELLLWQSEGQA